MSWTLDVLDERGTLLTVNNRLAMELRSRYDRMQVETGRKVWPSADILPWNAWLQRQYQQLLDRGYVQSDLLSPAQEALLWEDVIAAQDTTAQLLRPAAAAEAARSAYALLCEWQLQDHPLDLLGGDETRRFLQWVKRFEQRLSRQRLLSGARLPALVTEAIEQGRLTLPQYIVHSGFDTLSPAQEALFGALQEAGCHIDEHQGGEHVATLGRVAAEEADAEIRMAAGWALDILRDRPDARLGIVSPDIARQRLDLQRLFTEVVTPGNLLANSAEQSMFNISIGQALGECPLFAHALLGIGLLRGRQDLRDVGQLLRSPFIGGHADEWEQRALLDAALREDGLPETDPGWLIHRLNRFDSSDGRHCPDLVTRLEDIQRLRQELPGNAGTASWVDLFQRVLGILGWPGDNALDSHEFQQHERIRRLFSEFAELGKIRPRMRLGEAIGRLRKLAADTLFQPRTPPAPIQILGPLEAAGMEFDAIWLLGMDDQNWPPAPVPNPLLPAALQRDLGLPHASAARELEFATALTRRLTRSARQVMASHVRADGEQERRPSALTRDWPMLPIGDPAAGPSAALRKAFAVTGVTEPMPMPDADGPTAEQRGGAMLLGAQARCPFAAVATYRLQARPLQEPQHAPDAAQSGSLVHELLQRVWQVLGDSDTLARHDTDSLRQLVAPLATATLDDQGRRRPDLYTPGFRAIEAERLTGLIIDWLDTERGRAQAFSIEALEQDRTVELAGLRLHTRADRVDRLRDGGLAIIDYKTGRNVSNEGWFDERLSEPQLPLYCLADPGEVRAALLARVRADERGCGFVGTSRDEDFAPGVEAAYRQDDEPGWSALLQQWQQALQELADEVSSGRADPTPSIQACRYCSLGPLCRVREMLEGNDSD